MCPVSRSWSYRLRGGRPCLDSVDLGVVSACGARRRPPALYGVRLFCPPVPVDIVCRRTLLGVRLFCSRPVPVDIVCAETRSCPHSPTHACSRVASAYRRKALRKALSLSLSLNIRYVPGTPEPVLDARSAEPSSTSRTSRGYVGRTRFGRLSRSTYGGTRT